MSVGRPEPDRPPIRLTAQQREAVDVSGASVALSSGAGCGKTTVLTARFVEDLGRVGFRLRRLVALTFTEKAARELRERVRQECRRRRDGTDRGADWRKALRELEAAPIGTFHGHCAEVLRRCAIDAGIDPEFAILEESIAPSVREEALARCVRRWLAEGNDDLFALAVESGIAATRRAVADLMTGRDASELGRWVARSPAQVVAIWREVWETEGRPALLRGLIASARPCLDLLASHQCTHPEGRDRRAFLLEHVPRLANCSEPADLLAQIQERARVQGGGTKKHWPSPEIFQAVSEGLTAFRAAIKKALESLKPDEAASRDAAERGLRYARLAAEAIAEFDRAKHAAGQLDFDDLLRKTRDLLRDGPESVRTALVGGLDALLVDEFQDTDPIQGEILESLAGPGPGDGRLYLVGDPKQSIYRFRGAQPRIFQEFRDRFPPEGRRVLSENFRSVPGLLDFFNALFAGCFDAYEALEPGLDAPDRAGRPAVEFLWACEPPATPEAKPTAHGRRQVEARWIARLLRHRLDQRWPIWDPKLRGIRPAHAGDVVLLFRSLTDLGPYEGALAAAGFDYHVLGGSAYYAQQEVLDVINLLSAIEDPLDPLALAASLRSPFFGVSDDGLYRLATDRHGVLVDNLAHAELVGDFAPADRRRVERARHLLQRWRAAKDREPIAALLDRVLDESGYEAALLGEFLGARKRANARKLVGLARRFDLQGGFTLADFVARLRADLRRPPKEEQAATTAEDEEKEPVVRLMSIHQAKGREFPIVVLPDLDRRPGGERTNIAFDSRLGPLVRPGETDDAEPGDEPGDEPEGPGTSLGWSLYRAFERREDEDEALRLFYVAATRAQDHLILSAGTDAEARPSSPALKLLAERFDRVTGACRAPLPSHWAVPTIAVTRALPPAIGPSSPPRPRPKLPAIAREIRKATLIPESEPPPPARRPRRIDLDPAAALGPIGARVDRLIRAILADPRALGPGELAKVAARLARLQDPVAPPRIVDAALALLGPWVASPLARDVARAADVVRAVPWMVAWPPGAPDATVFEGRLDLSYRDTRGDWHVLVLGLAEAHEASERLRLLLSARSVAALDAGPIARGWRIRLGPGGGLHGEEVFDDAEIERAVRSLRASSVVGSSCT
jgi:ATP-dependent helicase/nuclease subunit A